LAAFRLAFPGEDSPERMARALVREMRRRRAVVEVAEVWSVASERVLASG